jgi:putative OPT family oligopeptide transporter
LALDALRALPDFSRSLQFGPTAIRETEILMPTAAEADPHYEPYIAPETNLREFTARAVITGTLLGMIFGASSLYLVLKVGITVSASIPVAVISITLFRILSKLGVRDATILEHNIVQTAGSAGESIAFGVGVTMPAIMILGFDLETTRVTLVAVLGAILGVLMMIPLRRALIVKQHGTLKYPEGTACAAVLKAGASPESKAAAAPKWRTDSKHAEQATSAATIFAGFGIGLAYKLCLDVFKLWKTTPSHAFGPWFKGASVGVEATPELLGIGYIIGPRIASIMAAGGVLAYLVLIPMITFFGSAVPNVVAPGSKPLNQMTIGDIRGEYILYIGAGAVAAGGIISLFRSLPLIWHGIREGLRDVGGSKSVEGPRTRTNQDLPLKLVLIGILGLVIAITFAPTLQMNPLGALLIVVLGFLFVTVSSRLTGEIGSSSNPISGMTVATLLVTSLIFLALDWTEARYYVTALSVGAIVCIASSNGGTTSQDLKTGFLVGGTPRLQQMALLVGVLASALILGPILQLLNRGATVYVPIQQVAPNGLRTDASKLGSVRQSPHGSQADTDKNSYLVWHKTNTEGGPAGKYFVNDAGEAVYLVDPGINGTFTKRADGTEVRKFEAPKATLMSYIIKGILNRELPWGLVLLGVMIAVTLEMCGVGSLAFAVGVYLPLAVSAPVFIGGLIRWLIDRQRRSELTRHNLSEEELAADADRSPGVLCASGYIAGGAIAGIVFAILAGGLESVEARFAELARGNPFYTGDAANLLALIPFAILIGFLYLVARGRILSGRGS